MATPYKFTVIEFDDHTVPLFYVDTPSGHRLEFSMWEYDSIMTLLKEAQQTYDVKVEHIHGEESKES